MEIYKMYDSITAELNGQIQDLQEAHETTVAELNASEARVKELARESETLRITQSDRVRQMEDDNRFYKAEVREVLRKHDKDIIGQGLECHLRLLNIPV